MKINYSNVISEIKKYNLIKEYKDYDINFKSLKYIVTIFNNLAKTLTQKNKKQTKF